MPFDGLGEESREVLGILLDVRDRLSDRQNWTRFAFKRGNGARCLVQVLCECSNSSRHPIPMCETGNGRYLLLASAAELLRNMNRIDLLLSACWGNRSDVFDRLISFNDAPLTLHGRVLRLLDRSIDRLQEQAAYKVSIATG